MLDLFEVQFRITPSDNDTGSPASTSSFQVDNSDPPSIDITPISEEQSAEVSVDYNLSDREADPVSLLVEYSTDGASWSPASVTGQLEGLSPGPGSLRWNSADDLDQRDLDGVYLRITPSDNDTGEPSVTGPFPLDNSAPPSIDLETPAGEQSGTVDIGYNLDDREGDAVSLTVEYSLDGGSTWTPATIGGSTTGLPPGSGVLSWQSESDAPGVDVNAAMLRAVPRDNDEGAPGQTGIFMLDNNQPPTAEVSLPPGTLSGIVTVTVTPRDPEGDPVDCTLEYDAGTGWTPASYTGNLSGLTGPVTVDWDTVMDLGETAASGSLRVVPADNDAGEPGQTSFNTDNTPAPPPEPEPEPETSPPDSGGGTTPDTAPGTP